MSDDLSHLIAANAELEQEVADLERELAEARKDAERISWLELHPRYGQITVGGETIECVLYGITCAEMVSLREAIDAARKP